MGAAMLGLGECSVGKNFSRRRPRSKGDVDGSRMESKKWDDRVDEGERMLERDRTADGERPEVPVALRVTTAGEGARRDRELLLSRASIGRECGARDRERCNREEDRRDAAS